MTTEQSSDQKRLQLSFQQKLSILLSFAKDKVVEQIQCVWFIILYLIVFQILILGLPIVYSLMIAVGIIIVIIGLAFFMEGLRLGLMPLGETLGSTLPRKKILGIPCLPTSLAFGFCAGSSHDFLLNLPSGFFVPQVRVLIPLSHLYYGPYSIPVPPTWLIPLG